MLRGRDEDGKTLEEDRNKPPEVNFDKVLDNLGKDFSSYAEAWILRIFKVASRSLIYMQCQTKLVAAVLFSCHASKMPTYDWDENQRVT